MHNKIKGNKMKTTKWVIDPTHSEIQFKVKHLMISNVTGQFNKFEGTVETDGEDFTTSAIHFSADIKSINTNNEQRDAHLHSGDFFDTENYPKLVFTGSKMERIDDENYKLNGMLSMRGVSKAISLNVELGGIAKDPWGNTRAGFSISGKINRKDWGISFGMLTDAGGVGLGEEVKLIASVQFIKQAELKAA